MVCGSLAFCLIGVLLSQTSASSSDIDAHVSGFLNDTRSSWKNWNISYEDGEILHDLVLKGNCKNIVEIGTSSGLSTIWLAWAAAKTGGKVLTIEVHEDRLNAALENFKKAGVADYIDARLGNAHDIVPDIKGPVDFIFCDADKDWYLKYFKIFEPNIPLNGYFTAHNTLWAGKSNINEFLKYLMENRNFNSYMEKGSGEGISVSCRVKEQGAIK
jgi:predicted O-methyltransferase YrrM